MPCLMNVSNKFEFTNIMLTIQIMELKEIIRSVSLKKHFSHYYMYSFTFATNWLAKLDL